MTASYTQSDLACDYQTASDGPHSWRTAADGQACQACCDAEEHTAAGGEDGVVAGVARVRRGVLVAAAAATDCTDRPPELVETWTGAGDSPSRWRTRRNWPASAYPVAVGKADRTLADSAARESCAAAGRWFPRTCCGTVGVAVAPHTAVTRGGRKASASWPAAEHSGWHTRWQVGVLG